MNASNGAGAGEDIDRCRACASAHLEMVLSLGEMPLADGFTATREAALAAPRYPYDLIFCHGCGLLQIGRNVPATLLFGEDYPYYSSFADALVRHAEAVVAEELRRGHLDRRSFVLEIGSNDGYLLQHYQRAGIPALGIEPAPGPARAAQARDIATRVAFFDRALAAELVAEGRLADVVHAAHVLAHVADPRGFVEGLARVLKDDGHAVVEVAYVRDIIEQCAFDLIYHEHHCYFSLGALVALFARAGLQVTRVERLTFHGGSLRAIVRQRGTPDRSVDELLAEERATGLDRVTYYADFGARVGALRERLARLLDELRAAGMQVAGYGAAAKGTVLLNSLGSAGANLRYVVDRNVHKQGKWVPGVALPIAPPSKLLDTRPDYVLLLPWNYRDEIVAQQRDYLWGGGRFIVPIPQPAVLEA